MHCICHQLPNVMVVQARTLFGLYPDADLDYLERRIREETVGNHGIERLKA